MASETTKDIVTVEVKIMVGVDDDVERVKKELASKVLVASYHCDEHGTAIIIAIPAGSDSVDIDCAQECMIRLNRKMLNASTGGDSAGMN